MLRRFVVTCTLMLGVTLTAAPAAPAGERPSADDCPAYVAHLRRSGELLRFGDRASALEEMRQARAALATCARESEGETALAILVGLGAVST